MKFALLWILLLASLVLFVFLVCACAGRLPGRRARLVLSLAGLLGALTPGVVVAELAVGLHAGGLRPDWRLYALSWFAALSIGAIFVFARALRLSRGEGIGEVAAPASRRWSRRWPALATVVALALSCAVFYWLDLEARSEIGRLASKSREAADTILPRPPPPGENARPLYEEAARAIEAAGGWPDWLDEVILLRFDVDGDEARGFLDESRDVWELVRRASRRRQLYCEPEDGMSKYLSIGCQGDLLMDLRHAAYLAALRARLLAREGKVAEVRESLEVLQALRSHMALRPSLIALALSDGLNKVYTQTLEILLGEAPPARLGALIPEIPDPPRVYEEAAGMLEGEKSLLLAAVAPLLLGEEEEGFAARLPLLGVIMLPFYRVFLARTDLRTAGERFDELADLARTPFHRAREGLRELERSMGSEPVGLISGRLVGGWTVTLERTAEVEASRRLALAALASAAYRASEGRYPPALERLVPEFIREIPIDPFDGEAIRSIASGDGLIIYSVGKDASDDGGADDADITFALGDAYREKRRREIGNEEGEEEE